MKIYYISDLHIDALDKDQISKIKRAILDPEDTSQTKSDAEKEKKWLVLAGDVCSFDNEEVWVPFIRDMSVNFERVLWVPGNHEYYPVDFDDKNNHDYFIKKAKRITEKEFRNVEIIDNKVIYLEEYKTQLLFTTLYSRIPKERKPYIELYINDFNFNFTGEEHNKLHTESVQFLNENLIADSSKENIVFSHFPPLMRNTSHPDYERKLDRSENFYFASNCFYSCKTRNIKHWVFGHTHYQTDFQKDGINFSSRPWGYRNELNNQKVGIISLN